MILSLIMPPRGVSYVIFTMGSSYLPIYTTLPFRLGFRNHLLFLPASIHFTTSVWSPLCRLLSSALAQRRYASLLKHGTLPLGPPWHINPWISPRVHSGDPRNIRINEACEPIPSTRLPSHDRRTLFFIAVVPGTTHADYFSALCAPFVGALDFAVFISFSAGLTGCLVLLATARDNAGTYAS